MGDFQKRPSVPVETLCQQGLGKLASCDRVAPLPADDDQLDLAVINRLGVGFIKTLVGLQFSQ